MSIYQTNFPLLGLNFKTTPKLNNIERKSNIQIYSHRLRLAEFFQNKEANRFEENLFEKQSTSTPPQNKHFSRSSN